MKKDPKTNAIKVSGCYIEIFQEIMKALPYAVEIDYVLFEISNGRGSPTEIKLASFIVLFAITGGITMTCLAVFVIRYLYKNRDFIRKIWSSSDSVW